MIDLNTTDPAPVKRFTGEYGFLSNFYRKAPFHAFVYGDRTEEGTLGILKWPSVEHYFQAAKCIRYVDVVDIHHAPLPRDARRMGRVISLRPDWEELKLDIMLTALRNKFGQNRDLAELLDLTFDWPLQEGNSHGDRYWGRVWNPIDEKWVGQNWLGRLLELVREETRARLDAGR